MLTVLTLITLALAPGLFELGKILTAIALTMASGQFELAEIVLGRYLVLLVAVFAMAWWSTVHSRALEPGKSLQALWLLLPFWVVALVFI